MRRTRHSTNFKSGKPSRACRHIQQQMPLFLDGALSAQEAQGIAQHLSECPVCQREREQWRQAEQALAGAREYVPAPGDLRTGFYARLAAVPPQRRPRPRIDWRVAVPTLAACGLAFGWLTAKRPVVPATDSAITQSVAASSALHRETAQAAAPRSGGHTANKPAVSANLSADRSNSKSVKRFRSGTTAALARNTPRDMSRRKRARERAQIALLVPRRDRLEAESLLTLRSRAKAPLLEYEARVLKSADISFGRFAKQTSGNSRTPNLEDHLYADVKTEFDEPVTLQRNRSVLEKDTNTLAKTMARDTTAFSYALTAAKSAAKLKEPMELREQLGTPLAALASPADDKRSHTFALGLKPDLFYIHSAEYGELATGVSGSNSDGIELQVRDSKRGFTSGTRFASQTQEQNGRRVLIIEAEDAEVSAFGETQATPNSGL